MLMCPLPLHAPLSTVDVGPDLLGVAHAPSFLRAICSIPSFGNSEIRRENLVLRYQQNTDKTDGCSELHGGPLMYSNSD
jgi:hypothetical protein